MIKKVLQETGVDVVSSQIHPSRLLLLLFLQSHWHRKSFLGQFNLLIFIELTIKCHSEVHTIFITYEEYAF